MKIPSQKPTISRKNFLKKTGAFLAGFPIVANTGFPAIILANRKEKLGVALVGLGYYSRDLLAPALQLTKFCELKGIVTGTPSKIPLWQQQYGIEDRNVYTYETMHEISNNDDIDVIYMVTPSGLHAKYAIRAAEAGKHVWCEKPMEISVHRCQSIIEAANKNKVQLTIGYRMQHEPNTQNIITYAKEKPFGTITEVVAEAGFKAYHDHQNWRTETKLGGGATFDMGVYCINAARYSTGEEPISVIAQNITTQPEVYHSVDEEMHFELFFPSGTIAKCKTSFARGMNTLKINCENGNYGLRPFQSYSGVQGEDSNGTKFQPFQGNQQVKQMDDNAFAILHNKTPIVSGEEGLRDVRICEAIFESASKSGERVQI